MKDEQNNCQYIIYACPVGELNRLLEMYLAKSQELAGKNKAHKYMPHCSLTGFFTDEINSMPIYLQALDKAYAEARNSKISWDINIKQLTFNDNWHGLELQADGLKRSIVNFAQLANSLTRLEELRVKDWLHLSLAYDFNPEHSKQLKSLAIEIIDLQADVNWELRFYQKNIDWSWKCLKSWSIV